MKRWTMGILFFLRKFLRSLRNKNWKCMYINRIGRIPFLELILVILDFPIMWAIHVRCNPRRYTTIENACIISSFFSLSSIYIYIMSKDTAVCVCEDEHLAVRLEILWRAFTKAFFLFPLNDLKRNRKKKTTGKPITPSVSYWLLAQVSASPQKRFESTFKIMRKKKLFFLTSDDVDISIRVLALHHGNLSWTNGLCVHRRVAR